MSEYHKFWNMSERRAFEIRIKESRSYQRRINRLHNGELLPPEHYFNLAHEAANILYRQFPVANDTEDDEKILLLFDRILWRIREVREYLDIICEKKESRGEADEKRAGDIR